MQIIQSIREKGAAITIVVIALSLIGFILMDANRGQGLFSSFSTAVGKVNGEKIEINEFNTKVRIAEQMEQQRTGQSVTGIRTYQIRDEVWNQAIAERIFGDEIKKLNIEFTPKELSYILLSNEPNNPLLQEQALRDPVTGKLNLAEAQKALNNIKKFKGEQKTNIEQQVINPLKLTTLVAKYSGLINASVYYPEWMKKQDKANNGSFAQFSYVTVPFIEIADSTIKVTDEEINNYVNKHKEQYEQEKGKTISYVTFSQLPSNADSASTMNMLTALIPEFAADTNVNAFLLSNSSTEEYQDEFKPRSAYGALPVEEIVMHNGAVYGPFLENGKYAIARLIGTKMLPDSVRARHILIPLTDRQTGQEIRDDATAKKLADSLLLAINTGSDFAQLAQTFSSDGSKDNGGDLGMYAYGMMVPEFQEFTFNNPVSSRGVVKTQFGYHVIEVTTQKDFKPAYKIAVMAKDILPSDATINTSSINATKASSLQGGAKSLAEYAAKNGLSMIDVPNVIKESDYSIGELQDARSLVRWINENKPGAVSEPFSIGDNFVVATINKAYNEGVQDASIARIAVEPILLKEKKTEIIIKKMGATPTLEAAASASNKTVMEAGADSTITFQSLFINGVGVEPKVIGAAFNKEYQSKLSPAFGGTTGVFVVKTNSIQEKKPATSEEEAQRMNSKMQTLRTQSGNWYEGLRKQAKISDNRNQHF